MATVSSWSDSPPERVNAVDQPGHGLELSIDVVGSPVVEPTAQLVPSEGRQIATSIDEKLFCQRQCVSG